MQTLLYVNAPFDWFTFFAENKVEDYGKGQCEAFERILQMTRHPLVGTNEDEGAGDAGDQ